MPAAFPPPARIEEEFDRAVWEQQRERAAAFRGMPRQSGDRVDIPGEVIQCARHRPSSEESGILMSRHKAGDPMNASETRRVKSRQNSEASIQKARRANFRTLGSCLFVTTNASHLRTATWGGRVDCCTLLNPKALCVEG